MIILLTLLNKKRNAYFVFLLYQKMCYDIIFFEQEEENII